MTNTAGRLPAVLCGHMIYISYIYNTAVLIKICRFLINVVKFTQTLTKLDLPTLRKGVNLTTLIQKRHILMRTAVLCNGINSGQL